MADFKEVVNKLEENRVANGEAISKQTDSLTTTITETTTSQNRSFGQSLALQFKKSGAGFNENITGLKESFENNFQKIIDEAGKQAREATLKAQGIADEAEQGEEERAEAAADRQQVIADEAERRKLLGGKGGADDAEADGVGKQTKKGLAGILGKLGMGAGAAMLGGGALLAAAGVLAGGAGYLLHELNDLDGKAIRANVKELLGISDDMGGNWEFFKKGGTFLLAMTGIGLGLAVFGIGSSIAGLSDAMLNFTNASWAQSIVDNVAILLSISDGLGGADKFIGEAAVFLLAMTGIGVGLGVFGIGSAIAGIADGILNFTNPLWAQSIVDNVTILLSLKDSLGGNTKLLYDGAAFFLAMTGIGLGLAVFGIGSAVASVVSAGGHFIDPMWATHIHDNVIKLLSIKDSLGGNWELLKDSGAFFLSMTGIAYGLAVFGIGSSVATLVDSGGHFVNPDWAQSIVDNVTTLLTISSLEGLGTDTAIFVAAMTGIGAGLLAFSVGKGAAGMAEAITQFSGGNFAQTIKDNVKDLLSIVDDDNIDITKADDFAKALAIISAGLLAFSGAKFVDALANVGAGILNFIMGEKSAVHQMMDLAENADDLTTAASALENLTVSLGNISDLKFDGSKLNMKKFANDLKESVVPIEAAIMGGYVDTKGWGGVDIKGLASPDVDFETAVQRITELRQALGASINEKGDLDAASKTGGEPVVISDMSSKLVTQTNAATTMSIQKETSKKDFSYYDNVAYDYSW